jgi:hypothetical protein
MNILSPNKKILFIVLMIMITVNSVFSQQINIPRVDEMHNMPQPYIMRDWHQVALGYDSLVFNPEIQGEYLPLVKLYSNTYNYPEHGSFYMQTYVGQSLGHNESINSMTGIIGASLCGIDKSNQDGNNWVLMMEEFFNWKNGQFVYGNNVGQKTGHDWWYDCIPNIFFYQLYSLYPETGHFSEQFLKVADRWLEAVYAMGGSTTPWSPPYMNYRAFSLEDMEPLMEGVPEPGASGALAWIFYQAYGQTGIEKYRIGAELCMEFFSGWEENPAYELQYLYGAITAARMNGELGTDYDLEKIMNWCFDLGPLRIWAHTLGWGIVNGTWGDLEVAGLNGALSVPGNTTWGDYAFLMNTFQQAGVLTPLVRYDDRYARAMGKYLLNMANSSRLFYPKYLPVENQDGSDWSAQYDPNSYIAYEAVRQYKDGKSPFATGDALAGGWAPTNHSLYSSSPVGYLGSILETTNVEGILRFDLLKTDFFHEESYPSYLIYNPDTTTHNVNIDAGSETVDIYDAVSNAVLYTSVSGITQVSVGADEAVVIVLIPAGSAISQVGNTIVCNNIVIDYIPAVPEPKRMRIKALSAKDSVLTITDEGTTVYCTVDYSGPDNLSYSWFDNDIEIEGQAATLQWISPKTDGDHMIKCTVSDNIGESLTDSVKIRLVGFINTLPAIDKITLDPSRIDPGDTAHITCFASDPDEEVLSYKWSAQDGSFDGDNNSATTWIAPFDEDEYIIYCAVEDEHEGTARDSLIVRVIDQSQYERGNLIAHYPFNNDLNDYSGNDNHGTGHNVNYIWTRDGAYDFNGTTSYVEIPSSDVLNCNDAITVTFWMKPTQLFERETYPVSHGLWHNRWKVSISNNKVRWTIRTKDNESVIVSDLDSKTTIKKNHLYQVTATYDGIYSDLYINSEFEDFLWQKGIIEDTEVAMTIGQAAPDAANNFQGVLDEIRIYDYALSHEDIKKEYQQDLLAASVYPVQASDTEIKVFPNPFQQQTTISYQLYASSKVKVEILDYMGKRVKLFFNGPQTTGIYSFDWDGNTDAGHDAGHGLYLCSIWIDNIVQTKKIIYN